MYYIRASWFEVDPDKALLDITQTKEEAIKRYKEECIAMSKISQDIAVWIEDENWIDITEELLTFPEN